MKKEASPYGAIFMTQEIAQYVSKLILQLSSSDSNVKCSAINELSRLVNTELSLVPALISLVPALIKTLHDQDSTVRCVVIRSIGSIGEKAASAIPALTKVLYQDTCWLPRCHAVLALGKMGDKAVSIIIQALKSNEKAVRDAIEEAIGSWGLEVRKIGKKTVRLAIHALRDQDEWASTIAEMILKKGVLEKKAISILIQAMKDQDERVRCVVANVLKNYKRAKENPKNNINTSMCKINLIDISVLRNTYSFWEIFLCNPSILSTFIIQHLKNIWQFFKNVSKLDK